MNLSQLISTFDESAADAKVSSSYVSNCDIVVRDTTYQMNNYRPIEYANIYEYTLKRLIEANGPAVQWFISCKDVRD